MVPNAKNVPNDLLCNLLTQNPSLLTVDISNKINPTIDQTVIRVLIKSCRYLTVLKLSDYQLEDPNDLLVLCGRVAVSKSSPPTPQNSEEHLPDRDEDSIQCDLASRIEEKLTIGKPLLSAPISEQTCSCSDIDTGERSRLMARLSDGGLSGGGCVYDVQNECSCTIQYSKSDPSLSGNDENIINCVERDGHNCTQEEEVNKKGRDVFLDGKDGDDNGDNEGDDNGDDDDDDDDDDDNSDNQQGSDEEDLYENDSSELPLDVEDHSGEFGCLDLETLWLDNINLTDQVAAVLLQSLPHLRDVNLSYTGICNPWRLIDTSCAPHLKCLEDLDVKSTALSRTALQMILEFHPELQKLSISSTTLPPQTYCTIAQLTDLAELELIGGQFYPCDAEKIFVEGLIPAIRGVGAHLQSLNLTYFAHVKFDEVVLNCPRLQHLDLSYTYISITHPCPSIGQRCPNLTCLNLEYAHIEAMDASKEPVDPEKVIPQMIGEPLALEELHLCGLVVSDIGLLTMYPGAEYPLRVLDVSRCKMLTVAGVEHLWKRCPHLTSIDLAHCKSITSVEFLTFEKQCKETRPIFKLEGTINWK